MDDSDILCVEKIFDSLKEKKCGFIEVISKESFLNNLTPEQFGKLTAIISRQGMFDKKLDPVCKQMATIVGSYDESKMQIFSRSFASNVNGLFFRKDEKQIRADNYASVTLNIVKYLNGNEAYKNNIVTNVYNNMPNFIDPSGKLSRSSFVKSLEDVTNIILENTIKDDLILQNCIFYDKKDPKFKEAKNYIKTPKNGGVMLANLLCEGRTGENTIQKYFEGFKKCKFNVIDVVESAIKNISKREDIYPFVKEPLINGLSTEFEKYREQSKNKNRSKRDIKDIKKLKEKIIKSGACSFRLGAKEIKVNDQGSLIFFFEEEKRNIDNLKINSDKSDKEIRRRENQLNINKMIVEKLQQNSRAAKQSHEQQYTENRLENNKKTLIKDASTTKKTENKMKGNNTKFPTFEEANKNLGYKKFLSKRVEQFHSLIITHYKKTTDHLLIFYFILNIPITNYPTN